MITSVQTATNHAHQNYIVTFALLFAVTSVHHPFLKHAIIAMLGFHARFAHQTPISKQQIHLVTYVYLVTKETYKEWQIWGY